MAEVQQNSGGGEGKKNKQKKQNLRVDFTPMVDMNMLLITFFMLCSTLLKPQTMNINMPSKDKVEEGQETKIAESTAITVILGAYDELFYYLGMPAEDGSDYSNPDFLQTSAYGVGGIRDLLIQRNIGPYEKINELKEQLANLEISDEQFREMSKEVQEKAIKEDKNAPTVMIKPTDLASYANMVNALDEMLICNIGAYTILDMSDGDRYLLYQKTGNLDYLTEEQLAELNN
jgi:Biopolymer transport protein ExbD/TolR.